MSVIPEGLQIEEYERRPFTIEAVRVTPENIHLVAQWCGGQVRTMDTSKNGGESGFKQYIKVDVKRALDDKQTRAYYGNYVLKAGSGFKVYTPRAFAASFTKKEVERMVEVVGRMLDREEREDREELEMEVGPLPDQVPTAGLNTSFISPGS